MSAPAEGMGTAAGRWAVGLERVSGASGDRGAAADFRLPDRSVPTEFGGQAMEHAGPDVS